MRELVCILYKYPIIHFPLFPILRMPLFSKYLVYENAEFRDSEFRFFDLTIVAGC